MRPEEGNAKPAEWPWPPDDRRAVREALTKAGMSDGDVTIWLRARPYVDDLQSHVDIVLEWAAHFAADYAQSGVRRPVQSR